MKEVRPLLLSFRGFLSGLNNPFLMLGNKRFDLFFDIPIGTDTWTSPFFTMRIDNLLVRLYVNCMVIR